MEHAGFDGLHNSFGAFLVCASLFMLTGVIMFGSVMVKAAMAREKAVRAEMKRANRDKQKPIL
jgi:hypothetical protein